MARRLIRDRAGNVIGETDPGPELDEGPSPMELIQRGLAKQREDEKKKVAVILGRCEALARQAMRKKDTTASYNFEAKLKTVEEVKVLFSEYENLKKEAARAAARAVENHPEENDFMKTFSAHLGVLDECFNLGDNFGWKPLK